MNVVSAVVRFLCGIALIVVSWMTYQRASGHVTAGEPIQIVGITLGASPTQLAISLGVVALIGVALIILGVMSLFKPRH